MKWICFLTFLICANNLPCIAQRTPTQTGNSNNGAIMQDKSKGANNLSDRIYFGGNVGGGITNGGAAFQLSPFIGYRLGEKKKASVGGGPIFNYFYTNNENQKLRAVTYGLSTFIRYDIFQNPSIFAQGEADYQWVNIKMQQSIGSQTITQVLKEKLPGLYAGAGLNSRFGYLMVLYNFLWTQANADKGLVPVSPFTFRVGFGFNAGRF